MGKIFVSYRRDDSIGIAGRIYDRLGSHFGRESVFMDVDTIPLGLDFRQHLTDAVAQCDVLLAIIGEQWLTIAQNGQRRLNDPRDFVRIEIEAALQRGIPVIPVLLGKAAMPLHDELPASMASLTYRQALHVDLGADFHHHVDRLIRGLEQIGGKVRRNMEPSPPVQPKPMVQPKLKRGQTRTNSLGMTFAWVPPGTSWLGGGGMTWLGLGGPKFGTTPFALEQGVWCGIHPVTQAQWQKVMGNNPSHFKGNPCFPVENYLLTDVPTFLDRLNQLDKSYSHHLPTEQGWEYICRGGPIDQDASQYHYYFAKSKTDLTPNPSNVLSKDQANFGSQLQHPTNVGLYLPNPLGIYDMHGNVFELTLSPENEGIPRGGCWSSPADQCTASYRGIFVPRESYAMLGICLIAISRYVKEE